MADDPQVIAAGMTTQMEHPITGPQTVVSPMIRMSVTPTGAQRPSPPLGAHTREVLLECGLSANEVEDLVTRRVVGVWD
jgi:crotonobetainyl-CoA:carnitine CoA-transferase CaiB-like acyl-CoA transferase